MTRFINLLAMTFGAIVFVVGKTPELQRLGLAALILNGFLLLFP